MESSIQSLAKYFVVLRENYDNMVVVGVAVLAILSLVILTQLRQATILKFSLAVNKFKYLTTFGRLILILAYFVFLLMITSLAVGLFV